MPPLPPLIQSLLRRPFSDIVSSSVLQPCGMAHSTFAQPLPPERDVNAARAYGAEVERQRFLGAPRLPPLHSITQHAS